MKNYKNYVRQALIRYDDVELAACALMGADQNTEEVQGNYNVCDTLGKLWGGMKSFMWAERQGRQGRCCHWFASVLQVKQVWCQAPNYSQVQESTRCWFRGSTETGIYKCIWRNSPSKVPWLRLFYRSIQQANAIVQQWKCTHTDFQDTGVDDSLLSNTKWAKVSVSSTCCLLVLGYRWPEWSCWQDISSWCGRRRPFWCR